VYNTRRALNAGQYSNTGRGSDVIVQIGAAIRGNTVSTEL